MNEVLERYRLHIVAILFLLLVLAGTIIYLRRPTPQPIQIVEPSPSVIPTPVQLAVYVTGAVVNPGVYYLPDGSRMEEALEAAGGPTEEADLNRVNLARRVHDEEQVYVPEVGEENPPVTPVSTSGENLININTATVSELQALPGIGPTMAQRIVDYREAHGPFASIEDILNVRGIGDETFNELGDLITVG